MSACEYDAPMTFLLCVDALEVLEVVRQKGEFDLRALGQRLSHHMRLRFGRLTQSGLLAAKRHVSYPQCCDACGHVEEHEPTWTIS